MALQKLAGQLADHGLEDLVLVLEVVVEGARGQVGAAHDVAHAGRAIAHLGEHRAGGLQERGAILRLVLLAPARALALFRREGSLVVHAHRSTLIARAAPVRGAGPLPSRPSPAPPPAERRACRQSHGSKSRIRDGWAFRRRPTGGRHRLVLRRATDRNPPYRPAPSAAPR